MFLSLSHGLLSPSRSRRVISETAALVLLIVLVSEAIDLVLLIVLVN